MTGEVSRRPGGFPLDCWYAVASASSVGRAPVALTALDRHLVLYRAEDGSAVALADRCAHRPYPLSAGVLLGGDRIRCGLCGFVYDATGACVAVPTQDQVPLGARVASFPVHESDGLLWVWFGAPGRSGLYRVPELPWLDDPSWAGAGGEREVRASSLLLLENFADVTQVPFVAPEIAPSVLAAPPDLDVEVSETTVTLRRRFPPAPLPPWQAALLGAADEPYATGQAGFFLSPAVWVDHWDVTGPDGRTARLRFTQLVTPITSGVSRVLWRVSRDFAVDDASASGSVSAMFEDYYGRVFTAMETAQRVTRYTGEPSSEVNVRADAGALKVRDIYSAAVPPLS